MKTKLTIATLLLTVSGLIAACNREDDKNTAGKGGNAILYVVPKHHEVYRNLVDCKIYIKYNAQDIPSRYDDSATAVWTDGVPTAVFSGLKQGNYYLYGYGYDTSIKQNVKGGQPYTISSETALNVTLHISETHEDTP